MSDVLVIRCNTLVKPEKLKELRQIFIKEKEDGVIVLPAMCEAVVVPDDVWIIMEGKGRKRKSMNKKYDELSIEEKEALIELCKDDPATFIETVLDIKLLEYQKIYVRETFKALKKQDKFDWRAQYFGEPYKCKGERE